MFYYIIYVSSAVKNFTDDELLELLEISRMNNEKKDLTGMLLYKDGNFLQILEGEENNVKELYSKLEKDNRHNGLIIMLDGYEEERQFSDWRMGFKNLSNENFEEIEGYSKFLDVQFDDEEFLNNPSIGKEMLLMFKKNVR